MLNGVWETVLGAAPGAAVLLPVRVADGSRWCLIPAEAPGVTIEPLPALDPSTPLARVRCAEVQVPAADVFAPISPSKT